MPDTLYRIMYVMGAEPAAGDHCMNMPLYPTGLKVSIGLDTGVMEQWRCDDVDTLAHVI